MNIQETKLVMAVIKAAYPNYYKEVGRDELASIVKLWAEMFKDEPYEIVCGAVKRLIATDTKGFAPVIGQIKEQVYRLKNPELMTEQEAWAIVRKSIRYYDAGEKYEALPPILKRLVGSPNALREWAMMDEQTVDSVVASNFMRSYKARVASEKESDMLPASMRKAANELAERIPNLLEE